MKVIAKNVIFQYGLQAAKYLFPFVTIPYLTRVLGPDVYAIRAYIMAAMSFAQVFLDYGFTSYGTRQVALNRNDAELVSEVVGSVSVLRFLLCVVMTIVLIAAIPFVPILSANVTYTLIAYLSVSFKALLPDYIFQGFESMGIITYRYVASQSVATALIFLLVQSPNDLLWVPSLEALAALIALLWSWENVLRKRGIRFAHPSTEKLVATFRTSSIFFLSNASTTIITSLTTLMIGAFVSDQAQISYWAVSMMAVGAIQSLYAPITNSLYPHMCAERDFALAKRLLVIGMPLVLAGTIAFAQLSEFVMLVLGGEEFLDGSYILKMVSPVLLFSFPAMLLGFPVLAAVGRVKDLTFSSIASSAFHTIGLALLALSGWFSIPAICVLRSCTEGLLVIMRAFFVFKWRKGIESDDIAQ